MIKFLLQDKTPREEDVYTIDWTAHLGGDTITGAQPFVMEALVGTAIINQGVNDIPDNKSSFWISGGNEGEVCEFRVGINTTGGKKIDALLIIGIRI